MSRKPIIVFEGIEGSGKSLHINYLANQLKKNKINFIKIREPGGSLNSEKIRRLILNNKSNFHKVTDLLLYFASRNENIEKIIRNNINKKIILIDRFIDSTIAYQHYGMGIDLNFINSVNKFLLKNIKPNFTFLNLVSQRNMKLRLSPSSVIKYIGSFSIKLSSSSVSNSIGPSCNRKSPFCSNKYAIPRPSLIIR